MSKPIKAYRVEARRFGKDPILIGCYTDEALASKVAADYKMGSSEPIEVSVSNVTVDPEVVGVIQGGSHVG